MAAMVLIGTLGMAAGCLLGLAITLRVAEVNLGKSATIALAEADASSAEARTLLNTMNALQNSYCSDADIAVMRSLVLGAEFLKAAGHMHDGKIDCSSTLGRLDQPLQLAPPDFVQSDGTIVYKNFANLRIGGVSVYGLLEGNSYVIFSPFLANRRSHFSIVSIDDPNWQAGLEPGLSQVTNKALFTRDGKGLLGETLYATRCSPRYFNCVTHSITIPEAIDGNRVQIRGYMILGGLLGLLVALAYRHSRGMEQQLRRAIRLDHLRVVYQPVVELNTGRIIGAEALARWTDEDGLVIGPDVFVKIAEEHGFVGELTTLVLRHTVRDFAKTFRANPDFRVNVNVTATDLSNPAFPPMLEKMLQRAGVQPCQIGIEITESSSARQQTSVEAIVLLRRRGHKIYIDDFGTGYSSLSYLHDLSIDSIKVDKAFTQAIGTEAVTVGILPQILAMADALNLQVVVEGVETAQQVAFFTSEHRSVQAQGWYFGYPFPAEEFHRILKEDAKKAEEADCLV
jgi:sensor c-di-GMP phosphodiesterase-like protein